MQIVVNIPEPWVVEWIKAYGDIPQNRVQESQTWLKGAVVLPKGHGRLIDADALRSDDETMEWISRDALRTGKTLKMFSALFVKKIDNAPTIIEADKVESED